MPISPEMLGVIAQGADAAGNLLSLPFNVYGDIQQMKLARRSVREQERGGKFSRLLSLMQQSNQDQQNRANAHRLFSLRGGV